MRGMSWVERLVLGGAIGLGLMLLVLGLRENAEEMQAAPSTVPRIPIGAGTPWDPADAVRSPEHCTTARQRTGLTWVAPSGATERAAWETVSGEQPVPSAIPFDEGWSGLRVHFCRRNPLELSRSRADTLSLGSRPSAGGRRIRVGLFSPVDGALGRPYRIELLGERPSQSAAISEEERPE